MSINNNKNTFIKNAFKEFFFCWFIILLYAFGIIGIKMADWAGYTFGVSFEAVIYTLSSPLKGADVHFMSDAVKCCYKYIFLYLLFITIFLGSEIIIYARKISNRKLICLYRFSLVFVGVILFGISFLKFDKNLGIIKYINTKNDKSTIFEDYYVSPNDVKIHARNTKTKNLLWICLESMEITYASENVGGYQKNNNYIPNLTARALNDSCFSFSNKESGQLGGFYSSSMTGWTMAALMAQTSGTPFLFPVESNSMDKFTSFAPNLVTLGDILDKEGYNQEFLCGSEAEFAGRKKYFEQHGNYKIFDYNSAIESGYIDKDYKVWWGIEDSKLYNIAKDELKDISKKGKPFDFMMLTVDTHHVDGYVCSICGNRYPSQLANVVDCADNQIEDFLRWCQKQEWYNDTVIVITGDHPRMDSSLVDSVDFKNRRVYNCFYNVSIENESYIRKNNREFVSMDIFPTVLYSIGYDIEGERLGLGTNLFSDKKTIAEQLGIDTIDSELQKHSLYFEKHFY